MKFRPRVTEPGLYLCCNGDVVTEVNCHLERFILNDKGVIVDDEGCRATAWHRGWKFLKLDMEALNEL